MATGEEVYEGMVVGENSRQVEPEVNTTRLRKFLYLVDSVGGVSCYLSLRPIIIIMADTYRETPNVIYLSTFA